MKKILKYLSIIIVVIAVSVAVYSISSSNQTVEMQNKEALAEKDPTVNIPCNAGGECCTVFLRADNGHIFLLEIQGYHNTNSH